jgi:hypothetical protein
MALYETVGTNQKQALLALRHGNEAVLDAMKPFVDRFGPVRRALRTLRFADRLPTPKESIEQWFGFAEEVLKEERAFALHVAELLSEHEVKPPVVKTTPKAA